MMKNLKLVLLDNKGKRIWARDIKMDFKVQADFMETVMLLNTELIEALASYKISLRTGRPFDVVAQETKAMMDHLEKSPDR